MNPIGPAETLAYVGLVLWVGLGASSRTSTHPDSYFLGDRRVSAWTACLSLVATEVTVMTLITVAGSSLGSDHTGFQLAVGYLIGRVLLAFTLLPGLFNGIQFTAYQRLHMRFGLPFRLVGAASFWLVRVLRDSAVLFASVALLVLLTSWSSTGVLVALGLVTLSYVILGGLRAVVWMDVVHIVVIGIAGLLALATAADLAGGFGSALSSAAEAGKLKGISWSLNLRSAGGLLTGLVGGAVWSAASYSVDHITVQRLLATGSVVRARRALIGTGILVVLATSMLLTFGTLLWASAPTMNSDLPTALLGWLDTPAASSMRGWVVAALFTSASSALAASAISLGSSTAHDAVSPSIDGRGASVSLRTSRAVTAAWLVLVLVASAILPAMEGATALVMQVTTLVYGPLFGILVVASLRRADPMRGSPGSFLLQRFDAWAAIVGGWAFMVWLIWMSPSPFAELAWPWHVPAGATVTLLVGLIVRTARKAVHDPTM